ncbi:hypothetical protein NPIL_59221 [Nephila pilipes]|uniref:Uncharacterized protein n=1 Tax=Nephila pilipes TaxID=299642 RepID=A0A8X6ICK0_NEPPI|nr:hypothetical protein NPIL_59221 [Nephila pilipes]
MQSGKNKTGPENNYNLDLELTLVNEQKNCSLQIILKMTTGGVDDGCYMSGILNSLMLCPEFFAVSICLRYHDSTSEHTTLTILSLAHEMFGEERRKISRKVKYPGRLDCLLCLLVSFTCGAS